MIATSSAALQLRCVDIWPDYYFWRHRGGYDRNFDCFDFIQIFCSQVDGSFHNRYVDWFNDMPFAQSNISHFFSNATNTEGCSKFLFDQPIIASSNDIDPFQHKISTLDLLQVPVQG